MSIRPEMDAANAEVIGVQSPWERVHAKGDRLPDIAPYRNNLTALSHHENLYFAAHLDRILVYQPSFPSQTLPTDPCLIISPPVSKPGLPGYIDQLHPHSINHLIVDELGNEEVLLCACDDGDVLAYNIRTIIAAANRVEAAFALADNGNGLDADCRIDSVKPFFLENVGLSAWGLAMHKAGRLIAVSSNTHNITVFAFGLIEDVESDSESDPGSNHSESDGVNINLTHASFVYTAKPVAAHISTGHLRAANRRIVLTGHLDNIPSVSFYNNASSDRDHWLVSTDIHGRYIVWDVWAQEAVKHGQFEDDMSRERNAYLYWDGGVRTRGWGALCLDLGSFKGTSGNWQTFGCKTIYRNGDSGVLDVTGCLASVKDCSVWRPPFSAPPDVGDVVTSSTSELDSVPDAFDEAEESEYDVDDVDDADDMDEDGDVDLQYDEEDDSSMSDEMEDELDDMLGNGTAGLYGGDAIHDAMQNVLSSAAWSAAHGDIDWMANAEAMDSRSSLNTTNLGSPMVRHSHRCPPPFAILHTTEKTIRMLVRPLYDDVVICRKSLTQNLSVTSSLALRAFDRLNMVVPIPELGIVAVANQCGRVALLVLTRSRRRKHSAFRVDAILPYKSQEQAGERPNAPLLGIAIGPIQGREKGRGPMEADPNLTRRIRMEKWRRTERRRRCRLLMTYYDGTVLSYEIGRMDPEGLAS